MGRLGKVEMQRNKVQMGLINTAGNLGAGIAAVLKNKRFPEFAFKFAPNTVDEIFKFIVMRGLQVSQTANWKFGN